jgi:hypothetical protein
VEADPSERASNSAFFARRQLRNLITPVPRRKWETNHAADCGEYRQAASLAEKDRKLVVNPQTNRVQNNESGHSRSKNDK